MARSDSVHPTETHDRFLAAEQAALRRVATLVAQQPSPQEVFMAVTEEVGRLLDADFSAMHVYRGDGTATTITGWSETGSIIPIGTKFPLDGESVLGTVARTWAPARMDSYDGVEGEAAQVARDLGLRSTIGAPIVIDGHLWGDLVAATRGEDIFPAGAEVRIGAFTELIATAVSNAEGLRKIEQLASGLRLLADEQAALRRVATLVAAGASATELFSAVTREVAELFCLGMVTLDRYDGSMAVVLASRDNAIFRAGSRWPLDQPSLRAMIFETGRPARIENFAALPGVVAAAQLASGVKSAVGAPIVVEGLVWGCVIVATSEDEPLPAETEEQLLRFAELVAMAIASRQARDDLLLLAGEQAALRRVATLVAEAAPADDLYAAVAAEVARVLAVDTVNLVRYEQADEMTVLASLNNEPFPVGSMWQLDGESVTSRVLDSGRPARIDDYSALPGPISEATRSSAVTSSVGVPIVVEGAVWGMLAVGGSEPLPDGIENRLRSFTELVATAISNTEARDALNRLADEQASLQRVATLVARGVAPAELFSAVSEEAMRVFSPGDASLVATVIRFDPGPECMLVAASRSYELEPIGSRWQPKDLYVSTRVLRTRRSARVDEADLLALGGPDADVLRRRGFLYQVGSPVKVEDRLWGAMTLNSSEELPPDTDARLEKFTELIATAVSNATTRAELVSSRTRLVTAGDEARRKIERNLHDGTQQRLVTIDIGLRALESRILAESPEAVEGVQRIRGELRAALEEVREVSHGLHPSTLAEAGLASSLRSLARRVGIGVDFKIEVPERPPERIEIGVYYLVSEALTNVVKHARAESVSVEIAATESALRVTVADDGVGGARISRGSGLEGLVDRVEALGGRLELDSPPGRGTRLIAVFPLVEPLEEAEDAASLPLVSVEEHLQALAAAARVLGSIGQRGALYVVDRFGRIDFMDEQGYRILGYAACELRGKPAHDAIHYLRRDGSAFPAADCPLLRPWLTGEPVSVDEDWFIAKDGSFVPVAYTAAPLALPGTRATVIGFRVRPAG